MNVWKANGLKYILLFSLILCAVASVVSLWSYSGSSASQSAAVRQGPSGGFGGGSGPGGGMGGPGQPTNSSTEGTSTSGDKGTTAGNDTSSGGSGVARDGQHRGPGGMSGNGSGMGGPGGGMGGGRSGNSSSAYATPLAIFAALFFGAFVFIAYRFRAREWKLGERNRGLMLWTVLGVGFFLRMAIAPWISGHMDLMLFRNWATTAADSLSGFYTNGSSDYPPFYIYILYVIGQIGSTDAFSPYMSVLLRLPNILADIVTAYMLYRLASKRVGYGISLGLAIFYVFNPAVFINSTFWGQVDSFFTMLIVGMIVLLVENRVGWSAVLFTVAVLMKPQGIIYGPVLFFELLRQRKIQPWLLSIGGAVVTTILVILPFSWGQESLWLLDLYKGTVGEYPYASVNAYNFFALIGGNYTQDTTTLFLFSYHTWGMICIVLVTLFTWWMYIRSRKPQFTAAAALVLIAGVFTFASSMHERYLFPAAALAVLAYLYLRDRRFLWLAGGFSLTIFLNTFDIFYSSNSRDQYGIILCVTSLLNVLLFGYLVKVVWDCSKSTTIETAPPKDMLPSESPSGKLIWGASSPSVNTTIDS
ncbi:MULTISPECIES: glycosyltransferase 87 family protein [Paenibacillus]|uniref:Glycosyltransferase 87 family protein n=1 Tax=Paenibacillus polymyxa TaxID=1406 RepID=A0AAP3ZX77_PAEPO|nr:MULTISPECIES: glycosyltransferase 87 family protein [Paenibacillus]MDH2331226.1 glycosyltransferase 87 family protein [Paenibacillus polymyxa]SFR16771.1 Mannosyltransferase related to Gpi18 [Paenibacillus sp. cl130]